MMQTITLNDGTVLDGSILSDGIGLMIFVCLIGKTIADGFALFSDPFKTRKITFNSYGQVYEYQGFTEIFAINHEFGNCNLTMRKAADNA